MPHDEGKAVPVTPGAVPRRRRLRLAMLAGLGLLGLGTGAYFVFRSGGEEQVPDVPTALSIREGNLLYTFHVITGTESLFDVKTDPRCLKNLATERQADTLRLRRALERRLGVGDLKEVASPDERMRRTLRGLGYL